MISLPCFVFSLFRILTTVRFGVPLTSACYTSACCAHLLASARSYERLRAAVHIFGVSSQLAHLRIQYSLSLSFHLTWLHLPACSQLPCSRHGSTLNRLAHIRVTPRSLRFNIKRPLASHVTSSSLVSACPGCYRLAYIFNSRLDRLHLSTCRSYQIVGSPYYNFLVSRLLLLQLSTYLSSLARPPLRTARSLARLNTTPICSQLFRLPTSESTIFSSASRQCVYSLLGFDFNFRLHRLRFSLSHWFRLRGLFNFAACPTCIYHGLYHFTTSLLVSRSKPRLAHITVQLSAFSVVLRITPRIMSRLRCSQFAQLLQH